MRHGGMAHALAVFVAVAVRHLPVTLLLCPCSCPPHPTPAHLRMSMGVPCSADMQVAMGSAVYGTPHITSNSASRTRSHIASARRADGRWCGVSRLRGQAGGHGSGETAAPIPPRPAHLCMAPAADPTAKAASGQQLPNACHPPATRCRMSGYDTMTRRSMYTGDSSPLFSLNSPNLTACSRAGLGGGAGMAQHASSHAGCAACCNRHRGQPPRLHLLHLMASPAPTWISCSFSTSAS